ncbi:hypothetical protein ACFQMA_14855 [Halosimplex aquaticum]|uniref:Small CPxCG-related zinc finger protein n=1 Tax=Halosimplex aquaticum TaxID=3026162 RepID=A0ABD5Y5Y6_9EURY|nr:hypothetical protein [Halosimplex aquaticum]
MSVLERGSREDGARTITSEMVSCPDCGHPTGVPLPRESAVVDDAADADGESPTCCPACDTYFDVQYAFERGS